MAEVLEQESSGNGSRPGWGERLAHLSGAARGLLAARLAMFRAELAGKGQDLAGGIVGIFVAAAFGWLALLLFTAFLAALLTRLLGSLLAGIAITFGLYAAVAAIAGSIGAKKLGRVRPFHYPATRAEIDKDLAAVRAASRAPEEEFEGQGEPPGGDNGEDLEARFREGYE